MNMTKLKENDVVLAILLERNDGFLPKGIRFFMNIWGKITKKGKKPEHNHAEIVTWIEGLGLLSVGSIKAGFKARPFLAAQPRKHWKNISMYVSKQKLTEVQRKLIHDRVILYSMGEQHRPYEFFNFISWIAKIATFGRANWSKDTDKRMECYESIARCYNAAGDFFPNPEYTDIYDFYGNDKLVELKNWQDLIEELL